MSLMEILEWIEATPVGALARESAYGFQILVAIHIVGLVFSVGTLVWFDLRLLGFPMQGYPVSAVSTAHAVDTDRLRRHVYERRILTGGFCNSGLWKSLFSPQGERPISGGRERFRLPRRDGASYRGLGRCCRASASCPGSGDNLDCTLGNSDHGRPDDVVHTMF